MARTAPIAMSPSPTSVRGAPIRRRDSACAASARTEFDPGALASLPESALAMSWGKKKLRFATRVPLVPRAIASPFQVGSIVSAQLL